MIGDLLKILDAVKSASDDHERGEREIELTRAIQSEIQSLFDDARYPKRRRSFGTIRKRLGIFDDNPGELKQRLFGMGARVQKGDGDEALWHLPKPAEVASAPSAGAQQTERSAPSPQERWPVPWLGLTVGLGAVASVVSLMTFFQVTPEDIYDFLTGASEFCDRTAMKAEIFQQCLDNGGTERRF